MVIALIRGIVTVGERALAVKGMALPSRMSLSRSAKPFSSTTYELNSLLSILKAGSLGKDKITTTNVSLKILAAHTYEGSLPSQGIHNHEHNLVERCLWWWSVFEFLKLR